jgi:hypothetical protein
VAAAALSVRSRRPDPTPNLDDRAAAGRFGRRLLDLTLDEVMIRGRRRCWSGADAATVARLFSGPLPEEGIGETQLLRELRDGVFRHAMRMGHPRLFGLFTPAPLPAAAFAGLPAAFLNQAVDAWKAGPAATEIEKRLIREFDLMRDLAPVDGLAQPECHAGLQAL